MLDHLVGRKLDRYTLVRRIGEDRLGVLFIAHDPNLQREVTIKVVHSSLATRPHFVNDFAQAARIAAQLDHPNLIEVFDFGEAQGLHYIVMEHIPGGSVVQLLDDMKRRRQWILLGEAVQLVRQLSLAVQYVRGQGAPPRSIRPEEIKIKNLQSEGLPYLPVITSLGISRLFQEPDAGKEDPSYLAYRSPEDVVGRNTDARSDVYALGVLLFELSTGQLPFPIQDLDEAVLYHTRQPLPPPRSIRPDLPESLESCIIRAMEKSPEARFENPAALAAELERIRPEAASVRTPPPALEQAVSLLVPYEQSLSEPPRESRAAAAPEDAVTTQAQPVQEGPWQSPLEVILSNAQLSVEPGSSATSSVILRNRGLSEGHFRVTLEGLPASWFTVSPEIVQLRPGEQRTVTITIQPPRTPQSRAGRYPLTVRAAHQQTPGQGGEARGTLTVASFSRFDSKLYNPALRSGEVGQIAVQNLGNIPNTFTLNFRDTENDLVFTQPQEQLRLSEGQTGVAEFRASPEAPRWIGSEKRHPFSVGVIASTGETETHSGEIISQPVIPVWLMGILLVVFLCIAGSLVFFLGRAGLGRVTEAQATAAAQETGTAAALLGTMQAETATALALADANQATLTAVTATAEAAATQTALALSDFEATQTAAQATLESGAATQTAEFLAGQSAATQTQAAVWALQTAQAAEDATQAAANATQAAQTAAAATVNAATAAAGAQTATASAATAEAIAQAQTATAQAIAAQTATAQAELDAAATATAAAIATQTAAAQVPVAYILTGGTTEAQEYRNMLQANGYRVDLVNQNDIPQTDFSPYQVIIIGPETGSQDSWGDEAGNLAAIVLDSGKRILGLGEGGYAFFGKEDLRIGFDEGGVFTSAGVFVWDPGDSFWSTPFDIDIPGDQLLTFYTVPISVTAITLEVPFVEAPLANLTLFGRLPDQETQFPILSQGGRFMLWGFSGGPAQMTTEGARSFINALNYLVRR